jgi:uncharacterized membrane protein YkoI
MSRKVLLVAAAVLAAVAVTAGIAVASGVGDDDQPLTGASLERATAAALAETGGGTVLETEVGDDGAAYEVEVRLGDGRVVELQLDERYGVIGREADDDGPNEDDADDRD